MKFICESCKDKVHSECPGNGRCDCQHRENENRVSE